MSVSERHTGEGTVRNPVYHQGPVEAIGGADLPTFSYHKRYFSYQTDSGLVVGTTTSVMFSIDRPVNVVWPYFKDFNLWQNSYGHYYSGVIGDSYDREDLALGDQAFRLSDKPDDRASIGVLHYQVIRSIPEYAVVLFQPIPQDGSTGGVSPGFHSFLLHEHDGKTVVNGLMEHAVRYSDLTIEQVLVRLREAAPELMRKWRDVFVPTLRALVYEGK